MSPTRRLLTGVVGVASAGFGVLALTRTSGVARWCRIGEGTTRALGVRDLGVGLAVAAWPASRAPAVARAAFDVVDTVAFGRGHPRLAAATVGSALLGLAAARAR